MCPKHSLQRLARRTLGLKTSLGLSTSSRLLLALDLLQAHLLFSAAMNLPTVSSKHLRDRQWYAQESHLSTNLKIFALVKVQDAACNNTILCWWLSVGVAVVHVDAEERNKAR